MTVEEAIKSITIDPGEGKRWFPTKAFQTILDYPEESKPYLYEALDYAIREGEAMQEDYILIFYAFPLLANMKDTGAFERIVTIASLPDETASYILNDFITEGLDKFLYSTYNGKKELLEQAIKTPKSSEYARGCVLKAVMQLCEDKKIERDWCIRLLKEVIELDLPEKDVLYTTAAEVICDYHYWELLPCIQRLFAEDKIDVTMAGRYEDYINAMFDYSSRGYKTGSYSIKELMNWGMWEREFESKQELTEEREMQALENLLKASKQQSVPVQKMKLSRNDACPCGSGKKYKKCCLQKMNGDAEWMEPEEVRRHWLKEYPELSPASKDPSHLYLEDFFDKESIEIDTLVYLALKYRSVPIYVKQDETAVASRQRAYLYAAFLKYIEKAAQEGVKTCAQYDEKFSIHFPCKEWLSRLLELLQAQGDVARSKKVKAWLN